jgi:DNA-binding NarL/FixJ family response regulator
VRSRETPIRTATFPRPDEAVVLHAKVVAGVEPTQSAPMAQRTSREPSTVGRSEGVVGRPSSGPDSTAPTSKAVSWVARRPSRPATARQLDVLAAYVAVGGSVSDAAARLGIRPSTAKRHLADLRARSGLTTEQLIYRGRAEGWLIVPSLESG